MFYGWVLAALGSLIIAMAAAPLYYGLAVWNPVLRNAFGWTAGQMAGAFAVTQAQETVMGPVVGALVEKLGPRRMVLIGMLVLGAGFALFSQIQALWQLYFAFFIMAMGASLSSWLPVMTVLNHWFVRHKSRAMAIAMEGEGIGGIISPLLLAWAIGGVDPNISERFGWSTTALFVAAACLVLAVPLSSLVRNRPEDMGLRPDGDPTQAVEANPSETATDASVTEASGGLTWREAIRTRAFWFISLGHAASSTAMVTTLVHLGLMLDDRGFSLEAIGAVMAVFTGTNAVFILVGGYIGDRIPIRLAYFGFSVLEPAALLVLVLVPGMWVVFVFAVMLGMGTGSRMPLVFSVRGVYFGRREFAAITGLSLVPVSFLFIIVPVLVGVMRDITGSYGQPLLAVAGLSFCGCLLYLLLGEPPKHSGHAGRTGLSGAAQRT